MTLGRGSALLALVLLAAPAAATEDPLAGRTLAMRQGRATSKLVLVAHAAIVAPLPGGSEDPTRFGASLQIGNPRTGEWASLVAPAAGWTMNTTGTVFRFRTRARGAGPGIRSLVIRHGRRLELRASAVGITLDEPRQGVVAVVLTTGTRRYCLLFGGDVRRDEPGKFAARDAPPPAACPAPANGSVSTTTSTTRPSGPRPSTSTSSTTSTTKPKKPEHDDDHGGGDHGGDR